MRSLPAILLAALAALVIVASAILTTQFGMRDWPAPPLPDTATRLVTPTEAAGRSAGEVTASGAHQRAIDLRGDRASQSGRKAGTRERRQVERAPAPKRRRDTVGTAPGPRSAAPVAPIPAQPGDNPQAASPGTGATPTPPHDAGAPEAGGDSAEVTGAGMEMPTEAEAAARPAHDGDDRGPIRDVLPEPMPTP